VSKADQLRKQADTLERIEALEEIIKCLNDERFSVRFNEVTFLTYYQCGPIVKTDWPEWRPSIEMRHAIISDICKLINELQDDSAQQPTTQSEG
jgi:hypothetical protein